MIGERLWVRSHLYDITKVLSARGRQLISFAANVFDLYYIPHKLPESGL